MLISLDDLRICLKQEIALSWPSNNLKRFDVSLQSRKVGVTKWSSFIKCCSVTHLSTGCCCDTLTELFRSMALPLRCGGSGECHCARKRARTSAA